MTVNSNADRLWDILSNLVVNAIRYRAVGRPHGAWVVVRIVRLRGAVRVNVVDNGIGIDPVSQGKIFDAYWQVDGIARDGVNGYGLGLSIVRRTVERLDGHALRVNSKLGSGSKFSLLIPISPGYTFGRTRQAIAIGPDKAAQPPGISNS